MAIDDDWLPTEERAAAEYLPVLQAAEADLLAQFEAAAATDSADHVGSLIESMRDRLNELSDQAPMVVWDDGRTGIATPQWTSLVELCAEESVQRPEVAASFLEKAAKAGRLQALCAVASPFADAIPAHQIERLGQRLGATAKEPAVSAALARIADIARTQSKSISYAADDLKVSEISKLARLSERFHSAAGESGIVEAEQAVQAQDWEKAIAMYEGLVERHQGPSPERTDAVAGLAIAYWTARKEYWAEELLKEVRNSEPETYRDAARTVLDSLDTGMPNALAYFAQAHLARGYEISRNIAQADRVWEESRSAGNNHPLFINRYSYRLERQKRYNDAIALIDEGLTIRHSWEDERAFMKQRTRCQVKAGGQGDPDPLWRQRGASELVRLELTESIPHDASPALTVAELGGGGNIHRGEMRNPAGWTVQLRVEGPRMEQMFALLFKDPSGRVRSERPVAIDTGGPVWLDGVWVLSEGDSTEGRSQDGRLVWKADTGHMGHLVVGDGLVAGVSGGFIVLMTSEGDTEQVLKVMEGIYSVVALIRGFLYFRLSTGTLHTVNRQTPDKPRMIEDHDAWRVWIDDDDSLVSWKRDPADARSGLLTHKRSDRADLVLEVPTVGLPYRPEDFVDGLVRVRDRYFLWGSSRLVAVSPTSEPAICDFYDRIHDVRRTDDALWFSVGSRLLCVI